MLTTRILVTHSSSVLHLLLASSFLLIFVNTSAIAQTASTNNENNKYRVYRHISPEGRIVFSGEPKSKPYIRLVKTPQGWVPENELSKRYSVNKQNHDYSSYIRQAANRYRLPYYLLHAVITVESAYDSDAISHAGAQGLMQLMPATAKRFGVDDAFNPQKNIDAGSRYLRDLIKLFNGDLSLALAAYNAGENAVIRYGRRIPPYKETREYVYKVLKTYRKYRFESSPS